MDEEENFAKLLSQSTTAAAPSWNPSSTSDDPWANPFSDTPSSNPFASPFGTASAYIPASTSDPYTAPSAALDSPREDVSPYVAKIEQDGIGGLGRGQAPDMPSVIAAREQAGFASPISPPLASEPFMPEMVPFQQPVEAATTNDVASPARKGLPSDLIDEDLLAASDPSLSLKKAFVKSTNATPTKKREESRADTGSRKAYVFSPAKKASQPSRIAAEDKGDKAVQENHSAKGVPSPTTKISDKAGTAAQSETNGEKDVFSTPKQASSIPLPESNLPTPTATRPVSPSPASIPAQAKSDVPEPSPALLKSPIADRVAVSPLDPPVPNADYGFQSLSIGASSIAPPPPSKSPVHDAPSDGWQPEKTTSPPATRFGGRGWGAMDVEEDGGLFGKGGPSVRSAGASENWGGDASEGGWGEPGVSSLQSPIAGPSTGSDIDTRTVTPPQPSPSKLPQSSGTPRTPKLLSKPLFQIAVGDPTRVGDPVRGYTVYTVKTKTTSPHYRRGDFSVLRRFSDFLWLFETLTMNNPGVIVPPVPDKHPFGRFQDTFIETRRLALQRCLNKITAHPVLQLDPDLRLFLESDHFATESKSRRAEFVQETTAAGNKGILSSWTGPKFVEQDEWFESRRTFLDALENQLKGLSKSIETAGKLRLDMALAMGEFANSATQLAESDLGSAMCSALARLADLATREKEADEEQAKAEVVHLLNLSDEYVRFIGSVRLAFASRIKCYEKWQNAEREVHRLRSVREKARQQGKLGDRSTQSLAEIGDAERKSRDGNAEFDAVSKLVKSEFGRFEKERVEEFKRVLERYLDEMVARQKELIEAWEEYHGIVLGMVQKAQGK